MANGPTSRSPNETRKFAGHPPSYRAFRPTALRAHVKSAYRGVDGEDGAEAGWKANENNGKPQHRVTRNDWKERHCHQCGDVSATHEG